MRVWMGYTLLMVAGLAASAPTALAQRDPIPVPTVEELVQALEEGRSLGAQADFLLLRECPGRGTREADMLEAISSADIPTEWLVTLGINWVNVLTDSCPPVVRWYEEALVEVIEARDRSSLDVFMLRLPEDISEPMRESLLKFARDRGGASSEEALRRAIHHSDPRLRMRYGLEAFVQVDAAGTVRDLFAVESSVLYSRLGSEYLRALTVDAPQMSDGTLSAVVTPIARSVALGENSVDVDAIRELRDVLEERESMVQLVEMLRCAQLVSCEDG